MKSMPVIGLYGILERSEQGWENAEGTGAEVARPLAMLATAGISSGSSTASAASAISAITG